MCTFFVVIVLSIEQLLKVNAMRCAECTARYARKEDVAGPENGRDGNDSMSADSEGFLSSSDDEDEHPTTGEPDL